MMGSVMPAVVNGRINVLRCSCLDHLDLSGQLGINLIPAVFVAKRAE